jgi:integrase
MPKRAAELGPLQVSRLKAVGMHAVGVVPGLHLQITSPSAKSWVLRATVGARRRDIGLGGYPAVTLAMAHDKARQAREKIRQGIDPVLEVKALRSALIAAQVGAKTFRQCAEQYIADKSPEWKSAKHGAQWTATLEAYALEKIGNLQVRDVDTPHVLAVLQPIWKDKTETATRVRSRMELILDWAATHRYRDGPNPARWKGHLDKLLHKPRKVTKVEHHPAIAVDQVGAFMSDLRQQAGMGAKALEFAVLTAARSGEVRGATWSEIDLDKALWTIPGKRMKSGKEHRVPLAPAAVKLLKGLKDESAKDKDFVFPAAKGGPLSDMTLSAVMRRMEVEAVPHGMRSSFRDWAAERTNFPRETAEMALAHVVDDKTEAAYRRGDLFEKRRKLMEAWATFCAKPETKGDVIPMQRNRAAR